MMAAAVVVVVVVVVVVMMMMMMIIIIIIIIIISIVRVQVARGSVSSEPMRCSQGPLHTWCRILLKYVIAVRTCVAQALLY